MEQLNSIDGTIVLVRGLPGDGKKSEVKNNCVIIYDHLPAEKLNELIQQSENTITRSGYSSIMDLISIQQKAILVPTPGQTEQEYLARWLMEKKLFFSCSQEAFILKKALKENSHFSFDNSYKVKDIQKEIIVSWVNNLK